MGPSVTDVLARAGMATRVVAGARRLSASVLDVRLSTDDPIPAGALLVASWAAARRDGALPLLGPMVQRAASLRASALLVVTGDRRVDPGDEICALAEHLALPLIWIDDRLTAARIADTLAQARSDLSGATADRRLILLEALSTILATGVDENTALVAVRMLPVVGVRLAMRPPGVASVLIDWSDAAIRPDHDAHHRVQYDIGVDVGGGELPGGVLEFTCTRPLTVDESSYAANLAALLGLWTRSRRRTAGPAVDRMHEDLLRAILGPDLSARESAIRRSRRLGVFPPRRAVVLVIEPFGHRLTAAGLNSLSRNVIHSVQLRDGKASVMVREGGILVVLAEDVELGPLVTDLVRRVGIPVCLGVSTTVASIDRLPGGYRQAQRATTLAQQLGRVNTMTRYTDLGFYRLLVLIPEHERTRFVSDVLGSLAGEGADQADLRRTLRVVGENRGNIKAAAERLFIHPNTLRQRIGKLSLVLGPFLDDADTYLDVYIALALHRLKDRE